MEMIIIVFIVDIIVNMVIVKAVCKPKDYHTGQPYLAFDFDFHPLEIDNLTQVHGSRKSSRLLLPNLLTRFC